MVKKMQIVHITILARKRVRRGRSPSPFFDTTNQPTIKPSVSTPHNIPHTCTDTNERP
jgi:hypothetical protein